MKRLIILTSALLLIFALSFASIYGGVALLEEYGIDLGERSFNYDYVIKNGTIIDGTGGEIYQGDLAIRRGKITFIGIIEPPASVPVIDATDLFILPGFIDLYSPLDLDRAQKSNLTGLLSQGVTTMVVGYGDLSEDHAVSLMERQSQKRWPLNSAFLAGHEGLSGYLTPLDLLYDFDYFDALSETTTYSFNSAFGQEQSSINLAELEREVKRSLQAGAMGLFIDFDQGPGKQLTYDEVKVLATALKEQEKVLVLTMPSDPIDPVALLNRILKLQEETKVSILLTPWDYLATAEEGMVQILAEMLEEAQKSQYLRMAFYPSTTQREGLRQPLQRAYARYAAESIEIVAVDGQNDYSLIGKTLAEVATESNSSVTATAQSLMSRGSVQVALRLYQRERYEQFISSPHTFLTAHWDLAGSESKTIMNYLESQFTRNPDELILIDIAKKLAGDPATFLGLEGRGTIAVENWADLVLINPRAFYEEGEAVPYLFVNGTLVYEDGNLLEPNPGLILGRKR
ncbi:hypothetical protein F9B85_08750 [Heliorestis acidaminivorans]|uniref:Amidohydrolase family protein n=1 Tax=Heliorestis acidaminivorans TaxID=553427 RepID=A0A6I0F2Z2_9FIRM|nr:hypothetical protein [Heliorestis acidaminivorans]KAB2952728.1 hypothetical protein F9B85_08750 [Heliorestis acidaminivorans]